MSAWERLFPGVRHFDPAMPADTWQWSPSWTDRIPPDPCTCDDCCARGGWDRFAVALRRRETIRRYAGGGFVPLPAAKARTTYVHYVPGKGGGRPRKVAA